MNRTFEQSWLIVSAWLNWHRAREEARALESISAIRRSFTPTYLVRILAVFFSYALCDTYYNKTFIEAGNHGEARKWAGVGL